MSHLVIYSTQFKKVGEDKYIPYLEMGDSNCYEMYFDKLGRERWRRERTINPCFNRTWPQSKKQMLEFLERELQGVMKSNGVTREDAEKHFGWYTAIKIKSVSPTYRQMQNLIKRGIKKVDNDQ